MELKEIPKQFIDYILKDVSLTLARLGVSEPVSIVESEPEFIKLSSPNIKQVPMLFKSLYVYGFLRPAIEGELVEDWAIDNNHYVVKVSLGYNFSTFSQGHNGTELGTIFYRVKKATIPADAKMDDDDLGFYVRRLHGLEI